LPTVSTRSGGIPEILKHRRTRISVTRGHAEELAQAISQVIDDRARSHARWARRRRDALPV
jgi:glycosyltransferase involved in cell wall biosynthesis